MMAACFRGNLIGTKDGIRWDREQQMSLFTGEISDGWFGMTYDPERKKYVRCVEWKRRRLDELKGREIRLESDFVPRADLYAFRAEGERSR